jgi:hypothetical protein
MAVITYRELFAYLGGLGFAESRQTDSDRAWEHSARGIILIFSRAALDDAVRGADLLSVETRLQHHGLLDGRLQNAIQALRAKNA